MNLRKELCCMRPRSLAYRSAAENKPLLLAKENNSCGTTIAIGNC